MKTVLVINAGSSSVKFRLFQKEATDLQQIARGQIDGIGVRPRFTASGHGATPVDADLPAESGSSVASALGVARQWLSHELKASPAVIGHRIVHGGPDFREPVFIDDEVMARLEALVPLAPLHQPNNLAPVRAFAQQMRGVPQVACFDTAFHRRDDPVSDHYALPEEFYQAGIRRYGFHGLSYEYIVSELRASEPRLAEGKVVVAHLGSGASMCAILAGRSVETTMGFTALDGIPMGTRPGQIDPGVILHLIRQRKMEPEAIEELLYRGSGLKGISGISNDVRELESTSDPRARLALEHFVHRIGLHAGMMAAAIGGADAFIFTAGIGENSAWVRSEVAKRLEWLGASLDPDANREGKREISAPGSRLRLLVLPTNEELMIARHAARLIA